MTRDDDPAFLDRAAGCLMGLAVGDAMGAPLRGMKAAHVAQVYGPVEGYVDADLAHAKKPARWTPQGLHGAHTQLALALGDALLAGDDPAEGFKKNLLRLAGQGEGPYGLLRGLGPDMRAAIRLLREGQGQRPPSALDASAAARVAPLAIVRSGATGTDLAPEAAALASLTTSDPGAIAASAVMARAVLAALRGDLDSPDVALRAVEGLVDWARETEDRLLEGELGKEMLDPERAEAPESRHAVSETLATVPALLREGNDDMARRSIAAEASRHGPQRQIDDPQAPYAPANVAWAVYLALRERRFDRPVTEAAAGGREAGAMAAMVGALAGARLGLGAVPDPWRSGLLARNLVEGRATAYAEGDSSVIYAEDLAASEEGWTGLEIEGRRERFSALAEREKRRQERHGPRKKAGKPSPPSPPPSTYARSSRPGYDDEPDPEQARKNKALRGRKRIAWKDGRRKGKTNTEY
jgi:ADP-ribosyl-[dinitrogen reductase] hydrolase